MGQLFRCWAATALLAALAWGCDQQPPTARGKAPTVASLVPAATDLLIGMGAGDHLVAIGNFDTARGLGRELPRVGDYQNFDWEQIAAVRPDVMIVFIGDDRMPEALRQRAGRLDIQLVNVRTETLADVYTEIERLGKIVNEPEKAKAAGDRLRLQLEAVRRRVAGRPPVRTLLIRNTAATDTVGRANFLDEVLAIAGGANVIDSPGWTSIDRETLATSGAEAVFVLLPEATAQVREQAREAWKGLPDLPAVARGRVIILDEWWVMQPGMHLGYLAERFARELHGEAP